MKIGVVLPSSNRDWLVDRRAAYGKWARPGTEFVVSALHERVPQNADPSDSFVLPEILQQMLEAEQSGMDAVIVDCMEDPGVEEGRRLVDIPVIGPGHAALNLAVTLGYRFSILYPLEQVRLVEKLVQQHGLSSRLASVRYLACGLQGMRADTETTLGYLFDAAFAAVREDGAHVIVPACTLTSGLAVELGIRLRQRGYPVPVVDGSGAAVKLAEDLVDLKLAPSRITYPASLGISHRIE